MSAHTPSPSSPAPVPGPPARVPVVIVGAGPAGLALACVLRDACVDCVVLEAESRRFIETRPRAGFLEEWAVRALWRRGLAGPGLLNAQRHGECEFRVGGERHRFRYADLSGHHHVVYPQPRLVTDLVHRYADAQGGDIRFGVRDVELHGIDTDAPAVTYTDPDGGARVRLECAVIAGCDGARGVSRAALPAEYREPARLDYGVGWLALLAEAPPSADAVVFGIHPRGFAAHMARSPEVTRYYLQCPPGDDPEGWTHDRVWAELHERLGAAGAPPLTEGTLVEKRVLDMHNHVARAVSYGRLFLAGDAAHLVAPIAAKGMNLALFDALVLAEALVAYVHRGDAGGLRRYAETCLRRVWEYQEFSEWFCELLHGPSSGDPFRAGMAAARLSRLFDSPAAAASFAEAYIGAASERHLS